MIKAFEQMLCMYLKTISPDVPRFTFVCSIYNWPISKKNIGRAILVGKCCHSRINLCRCWINYTDCTCYISLLDIVGYCTQRSNAYFLIRMHHFYVIVNRSNTYIDNKSKIMIRWVWSQQHHRHHSSVYWWQSVISSYFI
jgi:hypothetical protein